MQGLSLTQYVPGDSWLHGLDPRCKVLTILMLSMAVFTAGDLYNLIAISVICLLLLASSRIPAAYYWNSLRPFLIIIIPAALLQLLLLDGAVVWQAGPLTISQIGLVTAGVFTFKLIVLILILRLLTLTTTPTAIINGWERMLSPLQKVGIPVLELMTVMSLALAFIPFFLEEGQRVWMAQTSRGLSLQEGSVKRRMESLLSLLVPLWRGAFERSHQLAEAMEARGYDPGTQRSSLYELRWKTMDSLTVLLGLTVMLLVMIN